MKFANTYFGLVLTVASILWNNMLCGYDFFWPRQYLLTSQYKIQRFSSFLSMWKDIYIYNSHPSILPNIITLLFRLGEINIQCLHYFLKILFIFREEGKGGRKRGTETSVSCLLNAPNWEPGLQPRHVPWQGIKLANFWFANWHSLHWATPARASVRIIMTMYAIYGSDM